MEQTLLKVENLEVKFKTLEGMQTAVQGVSFDVAQGEVFCLVGESGCGKSLTSLSIMGLVEKPGIVEADAIILDGQDISHLKEEKLRALLDALAQQVIQAMELGATEEQLEQWLRQTIQRRKGGEKA